MSDLAATNCGGCTQTTTSGGCNCMWIILILFFCGGWNNNVGCGGGGGCGAGGLARAVGGGGGGGVRRGDGVAGDPVAAAECAVRPVLSAQGAAAGEGGVPVPTDGALGL